MVSHILFYNFTKKSRFGARVNTTQKTGQKHKAVNRQKTAQMGGILFRQNLVQFCAQLLYIVIFGKLAFFCDGNITTFFGYN